MSNVVEKPTNDASEITAAISEGETCAQVISSAPKNGFFAGYGQAWMVFLVSAAFVLFQFFLQLSSGEIVDDLMKSFSSQCLWSWYPRKFLLLYLCFLAVTWRNLDG